MSKLYEKWKPTYQAKHNRTVIGDDYVHLISNRTNRESILYSCTTSIFLNYDINIISLIIYQRISQDGRLTTECIPTTPMSSVLHVASLEE